MAESADQWREIYSTYTDGELTEEITRLKGWLNNPYSSQSEGQRGYSRSTNELRARLRSATMEQAARGRVNQNRVGVADFSQL